MKKKIISILLAAGLTLSAAAVMADNNPSVYINNEKLEFTDELPFIEDDRTLVPMRAIFEAIGASVTWDEETQTVYGIKTDENGEISLVVLQIGSEAAYKNSEEITLDVPAKIVGDRTFVPLRFVAEALDANVEWDGDNYSVIITTD